MKTRNSLALFVLTAFLASCGYNYEGSMNTIVNEDGTCSRELVLQLDSAQLVSGVINTDKTMVRWDKGWQLAWGIKGDSVKRPFPVPIDTYRMLSSQCQKQGCSAEDTIQVYAKCHFDSVEEMAKATQFYVGSLCIKPRISFKRKSRFFYTDYEYIEVFPQQRMDFPIPLSKFLTQNEIGFWFSGTPNLSGGLNGIELDDLLQHIKTQYTKWIIANYFELAYQTILKNYTRIAAKAIDKQRFVALHDALLRKYMEQTDVEAIFKNQTKWFREFFHSDIYAEILEDDTLMQPVSTLAENFIALSMFSIYCQLCLPHLADRIIKNRLTGNRLIMGDVVIKCHVRKTNIWAFVLTAVVLVASLVLLVVIRRRR